MQLHPGLHPWWVQDCKRNGIGTAAQMDLALPCRWARVCFPDGSEIATGMGLGLQKEWDGIAAQMDLGLQGGCTQV